MSENLNNRTLAASQTIYERLLRAYPKSHREEYGTAMAQLFRDQCRDAWAESQNRGVMKLWLHVLPDLVKTSFIERLAALNKRKSMTNKITALTQPRAIFLKVFVVVFLLILCTTVAVTFLLPETYASVSRIKVESDGPDRNASSYDPYFIKTTFEIIQSQTVLDPVIDKLHLNTVWGKEYNGGEPLGTTNTLKMLKERISLTPERNTKLINITVYSPDKNEAAQVANAIAQSYQDYRVKHYATLTAKGMDVLQAAFKQDEEQIRQVQSVQSGLDPLRQQLKIGSDVSANPSPQEQSYLDKKRNLEQMIQFHKLLAAKIESEKLIAQIPNTSIAQIVDTAKPGKVPVRPNKPLNIVLGTVFGIILALVVGGIAALIAFLIRKRTRKISAAT